MVSPAIYTPLQSLENVPELRCEHDVSRYLELALEIERHRVGRIGDQAKKVGLGNGERAIGRRGYG